MEFATEKSERLDKFLAGHHTKFSRSQWQRFIKDGAVKVGGQLVAKPGWKLKKGDRILILKEKILSPEKEFAIEPEPDIPLEIIYEDKDIAVINKQAGLIVHPTLSQRRHTLVNALAARYPEIIKVGENPLRPGIVHRLDKGTSGIMVIAKNQEAFFALKNQFLHRTVEKKYLALVEGVPQEKEGIISFQIRPSKKMRLKKVAVPKPDTSGKKSIRAAETAYKMREVFDNAFALLEVAPKTGRTHQIRVHLSAIGHPVAGDRLYGSKAQIYADSNADSRGKLIKRQLLHAYSLEFIAPNGKRLRLEAEMPEDMKKIIEGIKKVEPSSTEF